MNFLAEGSTDCPILRLYDFDAAEACQLRNVLTKLSNDELANRTKKPASNRLAAFG